MPAVMFMGGYFMKPKITIITVVSVVLASLQALQAQSQNGMGSWRNHPVSGSESKSVFPMGIQARLTGMTPPAKLAEAGGKPGQHQPLNPGTPHVTPAGSLPAAARPENWPGAVAPAVYETSSPDDPGNVIPVAYETDASAPSGVRRIRSAIGTAKKTVKQAAAGQLSYRFSENPAAAARPGTTDMAGFWDHTVESGSNAPAPPAPGSTVSASLKQPASLAADLPVDSQVQPVSHQQQQPSYRWSLPEFQAPSTSPAIPSHGEAVQTTYAPSTTVKSSVRVKSGGCGCGSCGTKSSGCECKESCPKDWRHSTGFFFEGLFLRPRDVEVAFAVPADAAGTIPAVQIGPTAVVDPDGELAFRAGFTLAGDESSSLVVAYTKFESSTFNSVSTTTDTIRSLVAHPSSTSAGTVFLRGEAAYSVDFETIDLDYRGILLSGPQFALNYSIGARYGRLEEEFRSTLSNLITETVNTDVSFEGFGPRLGLDFEKHSRNSGLMMYGRAGASFLGGDMGATYFQGQSVDPVIVDTGWEGERIVTNLELELGGGWVMKGGHARITLGYVVSGWFNMVRPDEFIEAVQDNSFEDLGETITFDGVVARAEWKF